MKVLAFCSALFFSLTAFAGELPPSPYPNAQATHQAEAGSFEFTPDISTLFFTVKSSQSSLSVDNVTVSEGLLFEYGFNDMFSLGANVNYGSEQNQVHDCPLLSTCHNAKSTGLKNPELTGKFKIGAGPGTFKARLDFEFSLGNHSVDSSGDSNQFTGGDTATLGVGYEFAIGHGILGADVSYSVWKQDQQYTDNSVSGKTTGQNQTQAQVFYEYQYHRATFAGVLNYQHVGNGTSTDDGGVGKAVNNPTDVYGFGFYVPVLVGGSITLYPEIDYAHLTLPTGSGLNDADVFGLSFKARFVF